MSLVLLVLLPVGKLRQGLQSVHPQGSLGSSSWAGELFPRKRLCCSPQGLEA